MPVAYLDVLSGARRSALGNRHLGVLLAFVAGAVNAGGFLAVSRYTSHMTGIVSGVADDLALGQWWLAGAGVVAVSAFVGGSACTALLINWGRRQRLSGVYAMPLMVEALALLIFGLLGASLHVAIDLIVPATVLLLCFIMGLQNAVITKISRAQIRTTHLTGLLTDLGIELGRLMYWNRRPGPPEQQVRADRDRMVIHATLIGTFFVGGVCGALAFKHLGFVATVPVAVVLAIVALPPVWRDLRIGARLRVSLARCRSAASRRR
ncbi:YoaK family protein [Pseudaquabacterium rugosum]|jgi:uncharacterized membrane protein YoaK (UPF0700 family)|uniref:YoaK family protein n=1 Tax=Pseudaquabacterium rugosum TaxID=2984194 RepID=A0ABU9B6U2_9BURK